VEGFRSRVVVAMFGGVVKKQALGAEVRADSSVTGVREERN